MDNVACNNLILKFSDFLFSQIKKNQNKKFQRPYTPLKIFSEKKYTSNPKVNSITKREIVVVLSEYVEDLEMTNAQLIHSWSYIEKFLEKNKEFVLLPKTIRLVLAISILLSVKVCSDDSYLDLNRYISNCFDYLVIDKFNTMEFLFLEAIDYEVFINYSDFMKFFFSSKNYIF